jgi:hypothetical protein
VRGIAQAEATHTAFGFSEFRVEGPAHSYAVGRLGDRWLRLTDPGAAADSALLALLSQLMPRRSVVLIVRGAEKLKGWETLVQGKRMEAKLSTVMRQLAAGARP